tara:strand:+ start:2220 stop:3038 length:819 start_codon:yes stop_codon:yes gene_type:complete
MKLILIILSSILFINNAFGQTEDEILAESYLLYNSEKASWIGTDIFLEKFPTKRNLIGGYFSYSGDSFHHCVFFDKSEIPNLLAKITFNDDFKIEQAKIDTISRKLSAQEKDLFTIRKIALAEMNQDSLFKQYNNTNLNPIPIITSKEKKVFVLTGPQVSGVVILGNDYLLTFDKKNKLKNKKALHKNIIPIEYNDETKDAVTMHSHLKSTGDLITSTDLCTIMLYENYAGWKQHIVISDKSVSLWDCEKDKLLIMTKKAWKKITEDQNIKE